MATSEQNPAAAGGDGAETEDVPEAHERAVQDGQALLEAAETAREHAAEDRQGAGMLGLQGQAIAETLLRFPVLSLKPERGTEVPGGVRIGRAGRQRLPRRLLHPPPFFLALAPRHGRAIPMSTL